MTTPTTVQVRFQLRADTAANWTSINPTLLNNEFALETDTKKLKVGDGSTAWNSLAYFPSIVSGGTVLGNLEIGSTGTLTFEGSTADGFETTLAVTNPTADRTITLPNQSGNVIVSGNASIVNADIAANAEIAVSKLADGAARQLLQTDAAGTGVEWTDNVDIPGTLDVTSTATFDGSVTIAGDLTVNGTTTTVNSETLLVKDKNIEMGVVATPTDLTADGGGITLKGTTDKTLNWVDATDAWTSSEYLDLPAGAAGTPSLFFGGDVNSGFYSPGADQVAISTNGTGRLFVNASGNVGVGGSPGYLLDVVGVTDPSIRIRATGTDVGDDTLLRSSIAGTTASNYILFGDADDSSAGVIRYNHLTDALSFNANTSERLRIASDGFISLGGDTDTGFSRPAANNLAFSTGGSERARIDSSGRLLVGTSSTSATTNALFHGSAGADQGLILLARRSDPGTTSQIGAINFSGSDHIGTAQISCNRDSGTWTAGTSLPSRLSFLTTADGSATATERLRITSAGNVGVGTTSPAQKLDVNGDALINGLTIGKGAGSVADNTAVGISVLGNVTAGGTSNTGVGYLALQDLTTGTDNTALGNRAGANITDAVGNTFIGRSTGFETTTGDTNTALGYFAFQNNTTGNNNIAIGNRALNENVAGNNSVAIGTNSQRYANNTATSFTNNNVSVGYESLRGSTTAADNTGVANVAVGYQTLRENTTGTNNTAIGNVALFVNTTGSQNVSVGASTLFDNTTGTSNIAIGLSALGNNVAGNSGVAIGVQSQLYYNDTATPHTNTNTAVGHQSLLGSTTPANNTGLGNVAIGYQAMYDNTSAGLCTAVGTSALSNNTTGNSNTAIGNNSLANNTAGEHNIAVGNSTLSTSTVIDRCTAVGYESQRYSDSTTTSKDANNTSVGWRALRGSTTAADNTGINNTAVGYVAMQLNTSGDSNVAVGASVLGANTTGDRNTGVGVNALLRNTTGADNTAIGQDAGRYEQDGSDDANFSNCTYLGHDTRASANNQVQLGDSTTTTYAYGAVQDRSDERDKTDIRDTIIGLDFINTLRPVDFRWDMRDDYFDTEMYEEEVTETVERPNPAYVEDGDEPQYIEETVTKMVTKDRLVPVPKDGSRKRNRFHHGLIAQEVKAAADAAGVDFAGYQDHSVGGGKDVLTLGYTELIAPLIKAVQELSAENAALKARLDALEAN